MFAKHLIDGIFEEMKSKSKKHKAKSVKTINSSIKWIS